MTLIPTVGRNTWKMRVLLGGLYLALSLGAVTMVYPFLVMLGQSVTSQYEKADYAIIPRYLHSDTALFGKYVEDKYKGDLGQINAAYGTNYVSLTDIAPPPASSAAELRAWNDFVSALPSRYRLAGFSGAASAFSPSPLVDRYHQFLRERFQGNILALDRAYRQEDEEFGTVFPPFEQPSKRSWTPDNSAKAQDWKAFEATLPPNYFVVVGVDPLYRKWLKEEAHPEAAAKEFDGSRLSLQPEGSAAQRKDWETFVRTKLPFRDVVVDPSALPAYEAFLGTRGIYPKSAIPLPDPNTFPAAGPPLLNWLDFLKVAPLASLSVDTPETRWRKGQMPLQASDWAFVQGHRGALRQDFVTRNYSLVLQYILLHGRAVWVTLIYCLLAVLTTLVVNPLCAYALSRYNLPYGSGVLLFLLATMSFPSEVSLIQNFLLLKQLGLLNSFAALILPGAASGYSIFLLKGFFDSLPHELYEAGTLDGASELRMFWTITLPLSRPIFAYIGLASFTASYGSFLYAMTTCQDHRMWTLMVWVYELQTSGAPQYVMMAALTLATLPTLLVFVFAQKIMLRGIILPSFK